MCLFEIMHLSCINWFLPNMSLIGCPFEDVKLLVNYPREFFFLNKWRKLPLYKWMVILGITRPRNKDKLRVLGVLRDRSESLDF